MTNQLMQLNNWLDNGDDNNEQTSCHVQSKKDGCGLGIGSMLIAIVNCWDACLNNLPLV